MARRVKEQERLFTRQDIYNIRAFWDEKLAEGWIYSEIAAAIAPNFAPASNQTIIRIGKRETWKEIGVGGAERAFVSNRLQGENRQTGMPIPMPANYRTNYSREEMLAMAERAKALVVPEGAIEASLAKTAALMEADRPSGKAALYLGREHPQAVAPRGSFDDPADLGDDAPDESPADMLARKAQEIKAKEEGK